ncbi:MAG: FHA domain-containing protein [Labilithrix sp.]|nr:FHA domain-containing protein [Labilithrix sp.]MCW5817488.1 FHA domain-containing protein [Labilithrix sp.]
MTCTTCGRDNPAHLTFCQECGQRLGPRIAPPTPPIGLGAQDPYQSGGQPPARVGTALGMTAQATDVKAAAPAAPAGAERRCKICDTVNGPNLRYCTSCGSTLEPAAAAPAPVAPAPVAPAPSPAPSPVAPAGEIAPMRVVPVSEAPKTVAEQRTCSRCRGLVDPGAQFCKFCGNPLASSLANETPAASLLPHERLDLPRPNGSVVPQPKPAAAMPVPSPSPIAPTPIAPSAMPNPPKYGPPPQVSGAAALAAAAAAPIAPAPAPIGAPSPAAAPAPAAAKPTTPSRGRLVVIAKSGADGPSYPFGDSFDVGRTEGNVVVPEDPYLSPRHVRIVFQGGKLTLRDLGSTNGVYLRLAASRDTSPRRGEGAEIAVPLTDQDMILVGQQVLRFDVLREGEGGLGPASEHGTLLFGSPAAPRYARLCQRTVEGIARDVYYLRKTETVLGRESGDVVFTEDPFLSRRHAAVRVLSRDGAVQGGGARFALVDLGSSNGTFLKLRGDVELAPGDHFRVGQQLFRVDFDGVQN